MYNKLNIYTHNRIEKKIYIYLYIGCTLREVHVLTRGEKTVVCAPRLRVRCPCVGFEYLIQQNVETAWYSSINSNNDLFTFKVQHLTGKRVSMR